MFQNGHVRIGYQTEPPIGRCSTFDLHHRSPMLIDTNRWSSSTSDDSNNGGTRPEAIVPSAEATSPVRKNTRQRHRFNNRGNNNNSSISMNDIPSFHDFQRSMQIRTLYRQYTRLIGLYSRNNKNDSSTDTGMIATTTTTTVAMTSSAVLTHPQQVELQNQVRTEFKHHQNTNHKTDVFYIQKSLAEGQRRYKELLTMIHGTTASTTERQVPETNTKTTTTTTISPPPAPITDWPWNKEVETKITDMPSHRPFPFKFPPKSNL